MKEARREQSGSTMPIDLLRTPNKSRMQSHGGEAGGRRVVYGPPDLEFKKLAI